MKKLITRLIFLLLLFKSALATETLLVGTTGDYPPLTSRSESGFIGTDITIIRDFAAANKLSVKFVPTTWQSLSNDLSAGKFTLAVGGISANPERQKLFYLSDSIESSAKVPLVNCIAIKRFTHFSDIDSESVTIVENRGGTNQDFALKNTRHATVLLVPGNFTALDLITNDSSGNKVMFTDDIEANYRHRINPKLCVLSIPERFPSSDKVFIFAKTSEGQSLQLKFNQWWKQNQDKYRGN